MRRHATTVLVAMVTAAVTAAGPALATAVAAGLNADTVDGKHAVGAKTDLDKRAGKLVATNLDGRLPNNIVVKAPDANKLDGIDSTRFLRRNAKAADADTLDGKDSARFVETTDSRLSDAREPAADSVTSAAVVNGSLRAGDVATLRWMVATDFSTLAAGACNTHTFVGFVPTQAGDVAIMASPASLPLSLITPTMTVQNANHVVIKLCNVGAAAIDPPNTTFDMTILRP